MKTDLAHVRCRLRVVLTALAIGALSSLDLNAAGTVPAPTVTGPIAAAAPGDPGRNYPFFASHLDLKAHGWVEEEFFIEGAANRYAIEGQATAAIRDGGHRYQTRVVVRRPMDRARFNGTAVVEWLNVTAGRDQDIDWFQSHEHFIRAGYAWIGVSAQRIGIDALKIWSPGRYGTLGLAPGGADVGDDLSFDIFAQAAQAVRTPGRVRLLGNLTPARVFATGHSQSAARLVAYLNAVHPQAAVFDAVVVHGGGGRVRADLDIPVFKLLAEGDVLSSQGANRQPDTARFRTWEVAGSSHVDVQFRASSSQLTARDGTPSGAPAGGRGAAPTAAPATRSASNPAGCERPPYSHVPFHHVMNAAFDHLVRWVADGVPPPAAPPIELTAIGQPSVAARDGHGNALGGIRLAAHAVPTAVNTGMNSGPGFCRLFGSHEPFDAATLSRLYPTHAAYVAAVRAAADRNVEAGYILPADRDATIAAAEQSSVGRSSRSAAAAPAVSAR